MKKISLVAIILASVMALTACGSSPSKDNSGAPSTGGGETAAAKVTVLKVARNAVPNPPFSYSNDKNEMEGYTVEYLKLLDERLPEYKFEYEQIAREAMLVGVESGKYDFAANFYYRNPEREAKYLFSNVEYGYSLNSLIVKNDRNDIHRLDDMRGKKLTPMSPSTGLRTVVVDYNKKNAGNPIIAEDIDAVTDAESVQWVASGKYDAFLTNTTVFDNVNAQLKLPLKIAAYITKEPIWVLFNKEKKDLAARFDEVTKALVEDGTLPALSEKYFKVNMFKPLEDVKLN
ncbi:transporter substrate-binding domain-containing protein [Paenibacillus agricola]|uniref:Transporter substrate-binding domain-containing protein n=1 Tax=Paenibacillus agricola TaxID=2716264 RepID=A0ABX0JFA2_9BACL|nr:transporter substrate-binding domain-containing protein [Paenibacillus agricola]NHN32546.1 transporter substrate-binding domain-containing protein [Paenibacillus agricola]